MGIFDRLASLVRRKGTSLSPATSSTLPVQSIWEQHQRIGGNITPADVSSIMREADGGSCARLVSLANDCRQKDGHLHAVLSTRENALNSLPFAVEPFRARGEREPEDRDAEVAAFVEDAIAAAAGDGQTVHAFADLVPHLNGAVYHGFAAAEIAWRREGRQLLPDGFRLVDQRRFAFRTSDGRLVFDASSRGTGAYDGIDLAATYPGQYLQHQPRVNGDVACREGLSHLLVWPATFRNWDVIDWLRLAEMAWKPWRIGRLLGDHPGKEDRDRLVYILERLTSAGIAVLTSKQEIDLKWPGQEGRGTSGSTHKELADWLGAEMSKAVLGQTLTTEQGDRGARSLGEVHDRVRRDIRDQDASAVAATIRRDLVRPLVVLNYGPDVPVPDVAFATEDAADLVEFSTAIATLLDAGMRIPETYVHDVTGIPLPQDDEAILGGMPEQEPVDVDVDVSDLDEDDEENDDDEAE